MNMMEESFQEVKNLLRLAEEAYGLGRYPEATRFLDRVASAAKRSANRVVGLHHPGPEREDD